MTAFIFILMCLPFILHLIIYKYFKKHHPNKHYTDYICLFPIICLDLFGFIGLILSLMFYAIDYDEPKRMQDEEILINYQINTYNISKDKDYHILNDLLIKIRKHNKNIDSHKHNYNNFFIGCMFSEEIANMEYIKIDSLKLK